MAEAKKNVLPITGQVIPECDIDAPAIRSGRGDLDYASVEYDIEARKANATGQIPEAQLFISLGIVTSFAVNLNSLTEPYQPKFRTSERRSLAPDDLTPADLDTIAALRAKSGFVLLRGRLGDLLWMRRRDHVAAKESVSDYVSAGKAFLTKDDWFFAIRHFQRALQIARSLGRKSESWILAQEATVGALDSPLAQDEKFFASFLFGALEQVGAGDPALLADKAKSHAEKARSDGEAARSRTYFEYEAKFKVGAKDGTGESAARLAAAMTYELEADEALKRQSPSYFAASDALARGIEALRRVHADSSVVDRLKGLLRKYQQQSLKEMKTYHHEVDLSEPAAQAAKLVENADFREALKIFVFARTLTSPDSVRSEVLQRARNFPLSHMLGASALDSSGRVTEHIPSLVGAGADEEAGIEAHMFKYAAEILWRFRSDAYIEPARRQIWLQHLPQQADFDFLVVNNPFVPPGHEGIFARGLYYGLCGDMLLAAHLLAPQLENSLRHFLEQNGVDVSNLQSDLTQPVKMLGPLLGLPETIAFFGPEYVFELRGLLIEKLGYSFRNKVAHGFVTEGGCYGPECSNLWWLTLRLCYTPLVAVEPSPETGPEDGGE